MHVARDVVVLHPLRDGLALRLGLHRQLPRPRRAVQLPRGRAALRRVCHHRCGGLLLSRGRCPEYVGRQSGCDEQVDPVYSESLGVWG